MPLPQALARFNRRVTNPVARRFAGRLPGFAIVVHRGRVTGREHRTPVMAFRRPPGGYVVGVSYGPESQWVRNVLANGSCILEARGSRLEVHDARLVLDPSRRAVPAFVRTVMRLLAVDLFMELECSSPAAETRSSTHGPGCA
jgi:deazaflavin-dependent oxidoreductase (nitroreductase family)